MTEPFINTNPEGAILTTLMKIDARKMGLKEDIKFDLLPDPDHRVRLRELEWCEQTLKEQAAIMGEKPVVGDEFGDCDGPF